MRAFVCDTEPSKTIRCNVRSPTPVDKYVTDTTLRTVGSFVVYHPFYDHINLTHRIIFCFHNVQYKI